MSKGVITIFAMATLLWSGCGEQKAAAPAHLHEASPPHGGTPVALGDDYQIEWVLNAPAGKLQAYFLDGEMENFVRIAAPSFDVTAQLPGGKEILHLAAVANSATGETVGDTSLFEAQVDWLKTNNSFAAVISKIEVKGATFSNIDFNLSK